MNDTAGLTSSPHKHTAVAFLRMVIEGKVHEAYRTYTSPEMRLHNIYFADAASLEKAVADDYVTHPHKSIAVKMVMEEGDRVMVLYHLRMHDGDTGYTMVNIFRFHDDLIVELWDLGQKIPEHSPNANSMF